MLRAQYGKVKPYCFADNERCQVCICGVLSCEFPLANPRFTLHPSCNMHLQQGFRSQVVPLFVVMSHADELARADDLVVNIDPHFTPN